MPAGLPFTVLHASIVLVSSQPVSPDFMTAEALKRSGIVPDDWQVITETNLPIVAQVEFQNGASIRIEGNRCTFQQNVNGDFADDYLALEAAAKYTEASRVIPYSAVGINWMMQPELPLPSHQWLGDKLSQESPLAPGFQPVSIRLAKQQPGAVCNLNFNLQRGAISLECNYHIGLDNKFAYEVVKMWPHYQANLRDDILPTVAR